MKMMNKVCALVLSVALCAGMAAPAFAYGGEPVEEVEQPVLTSTTEEKEAVTVTDEESGALTPEGNLTLVDDYHTSYSDGSGQQFITLVSKSGNTFYLVIDRNDKGENTVHFMNLVDESDLLSLMEEDVVTVTDETSGALTPEGNLTLVDDYHTNYSDGSGQQFITLVSKSGATFYLVIDRNSKGAQTVHFMNLVDETDLLALMEEDAADAYTAEKEAAAKAEQDKLKAEEEAKKAAEEAAKAADAPKENKVTKYAAGFLGVVALIALAAGGGFYFFIQRKNKKQAEREAIDPDADYTEDKGDFEIPPEDDSDDEDTSEEQDVTPT